MSGLSKTCFGFSLPLPKAENCIAEHHSKSSILTMLHPSQLGQNGGAKIFGHRYITYGHTDKQKKVTSKDPYRAYTLKSQKL